MNFTGGQWRRKKTETQWNAIFLPVSPCPGNGSLPVSYYNHPQYNHYQPLRRTRHAKMRRMR